MKTNLFSRFRNLFRRAEPDYDDYDYDEFSEDVADVAIEEAGADEAPETVQSGRVLKLAPGAGAPNAAAQPRGIHVPLAPIVSGMPLELQSRLLHEVGDLSIFLPVDNILPQLSTGSVSLTFGELREAAPRVFGGNRDQDEAPVDIPLSAILPHISPDMLARRHGPLQMNIPDDIVSPFEGKGAGLSIGSVKPAASAPTPLHAPAPKPAQAPAPAIRPQPSSEPVSQPRQAEPVPVRVPQPVQARPTPVERPAAAQPPAAPIPMPPPSGNGILHGFPARKPDSGVPNSANLPSAVPWPQTTDKGTRILGKSELSKPSATSLSAPAAQRAPLKITLSAVADGWPDSLKQEILNLSLAQAGLEVPYDVVESGLKRGRLSFPWAKVRSWIRPQPQIAASVHDGAELEFPLRVVAPLFVALKKDQPDKSTKVAVDKDIPNLFFGLPQPDTAGVAVDHAVNKPLDTNYYVWDDNADQVPDDSQAGAVVHSPTAGTEFVTRYATPNEVVSRAEALDGVEGAVIALPDGLMVASKLPPGLNGDTLAAFLPQLFGKVTQCTQELRMGELNNLNFTVGNVPWKIFRVNALYFAAFGAKGQPMPTAKLAALAGELDHKAKV